MIINNFVLHLFTLKTDLFYFGILTKQDSEDAADRNSLLGIYIWLGDWKLITVDLFYREYVVYDKEKIRAIG